MSDFKQLLRRAANEPDDPDLLQALVAALDRAGHGQRWRSVASDPPPNGTPVVARLHTGGLNVEAARFVKQVDYSHWLPLPPQPRVEHCGETYSCDDIELVCQRTRGHEGAHRDGDRVWMGVWMRERIDDADSGGKWPHCGFVSADGDWCVRPPYHDGPHQCGDVTWPMREAIPQCRVFSPEGKRCTRHLGHLQAHRTDDGEWSTGGP